MASGAGYGAVVTFAPQTLRDLAAYWVGKKGVNLGIVGDTAHMQKGTSYHLGRDDLTPTAYSVQTIRDRTGLSLAASAIDLGKLEGSFTNLRDFSDWLARRCIAGERGTADIREVIYSPDGKRVLGFKDGIGFLIPEYGDLSHLTHTHISYYRDSEFRDKIAAFRPYFEEADMPARSFTFDDASVSGNLVVTGPDHMYVRLADAKLYPIADGTAKRAFGAVTLVDQDGKPIGPGGPADPRTKGYIINGEAAFMILADVKFTPDAVDVQRTVTLAVDGQQVAEVLV